MTWSWSGPERAYARHVAALPRLTQMAQTSRPCTPGWDGPMGLLHAGDCRTAAEVGSGFAVAVAAAMTPDATIDSVIQEVMRFPNAAGTYADEFMGRMKRLLEVAESCNDVLDLREPFYREFLVTFPPWEAVFALEMVPCALALSVIARGNPELAIIGAANMGRDADTIASMAGQLCGALAGASAFPATWTNLVNAQNPEPDLGTLASDLCDLLVDQANGQRRRAEELLSMV